MAKRCPACNANRSRELQVGSNRDETPIMGRKCVVCSAQWIGELLSNTELNNSV